jgi:hypothetical protein
VIVEDDAPPVDDLDESPEVDGDSAWGFLGVSKPTKSKRLFGRAKEDKAPPAKKPGRKKNLAGPVEDGLTTLGGVLAFVRPITGLALIDRADKIAEALNDIAKDNDALYRFLERMTTGGKWGALATASFPVVCAAYIETTGGGGMMGAQAALIMRNGLSDTTMEKVLSFIQENGN